MKTQQDLIETKTAFTNNSSLILMKSFIFFSIIDREKNWKKEIGIDIHSFDYFVLTIEKEKNAFELWVIDIEKVNLLRGKYTLC